jgi:hypothetical protein
MGTVENLNDLSEFESKLCGASVDITKPVPMHPEANRTGRCVLYLKSNLRLNCGFAQRKFRSIVWLLHGKFRSIQH